MSRRIRRISLAGAGVLAVAGLATGASGALTGAEEKPEVRYVVNEGDGSAHRGVSDSREDCPEKDGGRTPSGPSDPASAL